MKGTSYFDLFDLELFKLELYQAGLYFLHNAVMRYLLIRT